MIMNATSKPTTDICAKRMLLSIMLAIGMLTAVAQPASAHKYEARPVVSNHYYSQYGRPVVFPGWLRKSHDFQRWYLHSDYRYIRGANWDRLYDLYVFEMRQQRRLKRRFRGRVYVDHTKRNHRRYR
jgi:hypothetical protein